MARFAAAPEHLRMRPVTTSRGILIGCLAVKADEVWSFVQEKATSPWLWLAMDKEARQSLALHVGDRSRDSTKRVRNLPDVIFFTVDEEMPFASSSHSIWRS